MKKQFTLLILILLLGGTQSWADNSPIFNYGPTGKNYFEKSSKQILIKFQSNLSFEEKSQIISNEKGLISLDKNNVLPAPEVSIVKLNGVSQNEIDAILKRLQQNSKVVYANQFLEFTDGTLQGVQDRILVRLKSAKDFEALLENTRILNASIIKQNEFDKLLYEVQSSKQSPGNALDIANKLSETKLFEYAEPDFLLLLKRFSTNDPFLNYQWSLNNTGSSQQYSGTAGADMNIFNAWTISSGSSTIKVAVIDEGVDLSHPDLVANLLPGYDATGQGSNGGPSGDDAHGTACAGIIAAAGNNNTGITGVAYNCKIVPVRIAYSNTSGDWVTSNTWIGNALNWAYQTGNADILSNSWGGGSSSSTINNAITGAVNNGRSGLGSPVLFAAGNDNGANSYPATEVNTISVIAMSMCYQRKSPSSCDGETWWGSNYGTGADIAAPGVKIYTTDISGSSGYSSGNYTPTFNGTSSATPNAAGVMALILSANPNLTATQARVAIESTCRKVGSYTYNTNVSGQPNGTWSNDLGYGLVNAYDAMLAVTPQVQNDAGINAILSPLGSICSTTISPSLTLKNFGSNVLNSVTIQFQIDGGATQTYNWTGSLASTSSTTVNLPSQSVASGNHSFSANSSNPNGNSDNVPANNGASSSFSVATNAVTLTIVLDNYPEESSWAIIDGNSNTVASGGTYGSYADGATVTESICIGDGCFDFVFYDAYGDGICCSYGSGSYMLTRDSDGSTLASGGAFTSSETTAFCLQESSPLTGNIISSSNVSCFGGNNGSAEVECQGGSVPYSYSWSSGQNTASVSNLNSGNYTVTITDNSGSQVNLQISISQPSLLSANASSLSASCIGNSDGSVSLSVSGGITPYSYSWSNGATSQNLSNVGGGAYSVVVTDANGCVANTSVNVNTVATPLQPQLACYETASFNTTTCSWDVSGNMPAQPAIACYETASFNTISCSWDVSGAMPAQPALACYETATFNTISCSWDVSGDMPAQPAIACYETASFNTTSCSWDVSGDMPAQPALACYETATFNTTSCSWDVSGEMPVQPQVECYEVANFNTISCAWEVSGSTTEPPNIACYETASFNATLCQWEITGDMPGQPALACYETASFNTTSCSWDVIGDMPAQPQLACYETATFNTTSCSWEVSGSNVEASISSEDVSCNGGNDGSVSLSVSGGTSPYSYSWTNGASSQNLSSVVAGSYTVSIADANGCSISASTNVGQPAAISILLTSTSVTCNGNDGGVSSSVTGGTSPYAYSWSNGFNTQNLAGVSAGFYTLNVTDGNSCNASATTEVKIDCNTGCSYVTFDSNNFESGLGMWNSSGSDSYLSSTSAYAYSGNYSLELRDNSLTSSFTTSSINMTGVSELTVSFSYYPRSMDNSSEDFWLQISTDGGSSFSTIEEWNFGDEFVNNQRYNETVVFAGTFSDNTQLRFRCDASGNSDWVNIDDVTISGCRGEVAPTCFDGFQNGDETGIDCGGSECVPCSQACVSQTISSNDIESNWGIWIDGGSDCARVNNSSYANSGSFTFRLRDNSGTSSSTTTTAMNLSAYSEATVNFSFYAESMENGEDFWLQVSSDGVNFSNVATYVANGNFNNNTRYNEQVVIPGPFSSSTYFRFRCDASNNSDWVYLDDIEISGCYTGLPRLESTVESAIEEEIVSNLNEVKLFPNPANGLLNIELSLNKIANVQIVVMDLSGKIIQTQNFQHIEDTMRAQISTQNLASGMYLVSFISEAELVTKRFVVQH